MLISPRTGALAATGDEPRPWAARVPSEVWVVAAITLVGGVLRFATITSQSYWVDEATTVHEMHLGFGAMLHSVHVDETTPPLYFTVAWLWAKVFGTGELGLRSLSALLGIAVIPVAYVCGRDLVSRAAGVVAAAFAALSPFLIWYSQEARAYMLFALLSGLSFLFFIRARREPSNRNIVWWAVFSALAILTHFFAGFLVAPEGIWLVLGTRRRAMLLAAGAVAAVQIAVFPLAVSDTSHPLGWINQFPLSIRIKQVPIDLGASSLYQSSLVTHGLLIAGVLALLVLLLLVFGGGREERRGAGVAAAIAAAVILVPLLLAALGRDYYVPRNLTPAWIPLAVLIAAACTAPRTLPAGAALAALLLGAFVYAGIRIEENYQYQRPNWRGVAAALGRARVPRAVVAYDGNFASEPLSVYLSGVPWAVSASQSLTVGEVDVVGDVWQTPAPALPAGTRLLSTRAVDDHLVARFAVSPAWRLTPGALAVRAGSLLGPAPPGSAVLFQP
jgi:uncharacterized membrane protein